MNDALAALMSSKQPDICNHFYIQAKGWMAALADPGS
jgi:hypothetical protein